MRSFFSGADDKTAKKTDKQRLDNTNNPILNKKPISPTVTNSPVTTTTTNIPHHVHTSDFEGPLLIYENDKPIKNKTKTGFLPLSPQNIPINPEENDSVNSHNDDLIDNYKNTRPEGPPYEHSVPWPTGPKNPTKPIKDEVLIKPIYDNSKIPSYVGPFNPDNNKAPQVKSKKPNKTANNALPTKQKGEQFIPHQLPFDPHQSHYPNLQNLQNPEEILQIINQHPELSNYPAGSVFEIHNYPQDVNRKPVNPEFLVPQNKYPQNPVRKPPPHNQSPIGPYLINQIDPNVQNINSNNFASNIPIDQLIKHVQEGQIPPGLPRPIAPYNQNSQFSQNPIFAQPGLQYSVLNNQPQLNQSTGGNLTLFVCVCVFLNVLCTKFISL